MAMRQAGGAAEDSQRLTAVAGGGRTSSMRSISSISRQRAPSAAVHCLARSSRDRVASNSFCMACTNTSALVFMERWDRFDGWRMVGHGCNSTCGHCACALVLTTCSRQRTPGPSTEAVYCAASQRCGYLADKTQLPCHAGHGGLLIARTSVEEAGAGGS